MRQFPVSLAVVAVLLLGLVVPIGRDTAAQEATPAACPTTSPEENKAIVTQFYDAAGGSGADLSTLLTDGHVHHDQTGEEQTNMADRVSTGQEDYPDLTITVERMVAEADMVAVYVTFAGTHQDDDEERSIPATGNQAEWVATGFFRIECGKIAEDWTVSDWLGRLQDLGVITEEEMQSVEAAATPAP